MPPSCARLVIALACAWALLATPASAADFSSSQIIDAVNAERTANGIPGDLTESSTMTSDCFAHDKYGDDHGGFDSSNAHGESQSGATTEGITGGNHSVLAQGSRWTAGNPWRDAPFHLLQVMNPRLTVTGADEHGFAPFNCLWTAPQDQNGVDTSRAHPAAATFWSFPGDGNTGVPWFEYSDSELPQNPNQVVGIDRHAPTGFDLQLYWDGPTSGPDLSVLCAATLTKTGGAAVDVGRINTANYGLFAGSSLIVPKQPLEPSTHYDVSATFSDTDPCSATTDPRSFGFTTEPKKPVDQMEHIDDLTPSTAHPGWVDLHYRIDEPLATRTTGSAVLTSNYLGTPASGLNFGWGSGGVFFSPPGPGQWVKLKITNDPLTIGTTSWASTPVERTFNGPAAPPPDNGGGGTGGGTTPVPILGGSTGGGAAGSPAKTGSGATPKAKAKKKAKAKRCHKAKHKKSKKKCKPAHHKKKKKKKKH